MIRLDIYNLPEGDIKFRSNISPEHIPTYLQPMLFCNMLLEISEKDRMSGR